MRGHYLEVSYPSQTVWRLVSISILKSAKWVVFQTAALSCPFCVSRQALWWQNSASGSLGAGDKKINNVARKEEGIIADIIPSVPGHVGVFCLICVLETPVSRRGYFFKNSGFWRECFQGWAGIEIFCISCISEHSKLFPMHGNSFLSRTGENWNFQLRSISLAENELLSKMFPMLASSVLTQNKEGTRRHWYSIFWIFVYL